MKRMGYTMMLILNVMSFKFIKGEDKGDFSTTMIINLVLE